MIDFGRLTLRQKRRIEDHLDIYFSKRRSELLKRMVDGTIDTGLRMRPGDKISFINQIEIDYADMDKIIHSTKPMEKIFIRPIDDNCFLRAYETCRGAKRKKEVEAERASRGVD